MIYSMPADFKSSSQRGIPKQPQATAIIESQKYARKFELGLNFWERQPDGSKTILLSYETIRAAVAEFLGMVIFVFNVATASHLVGRRDSMTNETSASIILIAFVVGLSIFLLVYTMVKVSGAHLNPAVSMALLVGKRIPVERFVVYVICQVLGAMAGAGIATDLLGSSDDGFKASVDDIDVGDTFAGEVMCTFLFVLTIFAATDGELDRTHAFTELLAPWVIGMVVSLSHLIIIPLHGSINPAPSFGIAFIDNVWEHQWIFWIGPLLGGVLATVAWETILRPDQLVGFQKPIVQAATV
ncbi:unnamed protein product [Ascophyllum nodosum]